MDALETIRDQIPDFGGYGDRLARRASDERIRAYAGERLTALVASKGLSDDERSAYDALMFRCEFTNQHAFHAFESHPEPGRISALLDADAQLVTLARSLGTPDCTDVRTVLQGLHDAFARRDAAMQHA